MQTTREITIGLNIKNPNLFYSDKNTNLMALLNEKYVGRCIRNCFVNGIKQVLQVGDCTVGKSGGDPCSGSLAVRFEVNAEVYNPGYVTHVKVISVDPDHIVCMRDHIKCVLRKTQLLESIRVGQIIFVRIENVDYPVGAPTVSITSTFYTAAQTQTYLATDDTPDTDVGLLLNSIKSLCEEEKSKLKKAPASAVNLFTTLLNGQQRTNSIEIDSIIPGQHVVRDRTCTLSDSVCIVVTQAPDIFVSLEISKVKHAMFTDHLIYLKTINEMIAVYNTPQLVKDHQNIWRVYKSAQANKNAD